MMTEKTKRLQIVLRHSIPAEAHILKMLADMPPGVARQHLLRNILQAGAQAIAGSPVLPVVNPVSQIINQPPVPKPASTPPVMPAPAIPEPTAVENPRKRLANLM